MAIIVGGIVGSAAALAPTRARAQAAAPNQATVDRIVQMNQKALDDYDTLEWDAAKRRLLEALVLGKKAGLDNHPVLARTYIHLGATYVTGYKDKQKGLQSFVRALEIDPSITIQKGMLTPELSELFAQASKQAKPKAAAKPAASPPAEAAPAKAASAPAAETPAAPPPPSARPMAAHRGLLSKEGEVPPPPKPVLKSDTESDEPDLPVHINALDCPVADETSPNRSISVRCALAPELGAKGVVLFYRAPGTEDYAQAPMKKTPKGWFMARIPKKVVIGKTVQYYIEARGAGGKPIASNGRDDSPNLIIIRAQVPGEEPEGDDEPGRRETEENPLEAKEEALPTEGNRRIWFGLMLGTGFGYAGNSGPEARPELKNDFVAGNAWSSLGHLAPEVGLHLGDATSPWALALQLRYQIITQPSNSMLQRPPATSALAVLGRFMAFTAPRRWRLFAAAALGGGAIRLIIYPDRNDRSFKDTVRGGPVLAGVSAGFTIEMRPHLWFVFEVSELAGLPDVSTVTDVHLGVQLAF